MTELKQKKCGPCEDGTPPLSTQQIQTLIQEINGWTYNSEDRRIEKEIEFSSYLAGIDFVNKVAEIAESEAHHPDIYIYYRKIRLTIYTHSIGGLSENDFILAAKIDQLSL